MAQDVADQERALLHGAFHGPSMTSLVGACRREDRSLWWRDWAVRRDGARGWRRSGPLGRTTAKRQCPGSMAGRTAPERWGRCCSSRGDWRAVRGTRPLDLGFQPSSWSMAGPGCHSTPRTRGSVRRSGDGLLEHGRQFFGALGGQPGRLKWKLGPILECDVDLDGLHTGDASRRGLN